jgi:hypothetical protein
MVRDALFREAGGFPNLRAILNRDWHCLARSGWTIGINLMRGAGAKILSGPGVIAGALADIAIGLAILYRPTARWGLFAALALSGFYLFAGTILAPELWRDPLGALLKIFPFVALNLVALAILKER